MALPLSGDFVTDDPGCCAGNGMVLRQGKLYVLTPFGDGSGDDRVQVMAFDKGMLTDTLVQVISDPDMDGVASGAFFGNSLYVNDARYTTVPKADTEYWLTRLHIKGKHGRSE